MVKGELRMSFQEEKVWEQRQAARRMAARFGRNALICLMAFGYMVVSKWLDIYDWRFGILAVLVMALAGAPMLTIAFSWHKLRLAPKCPACGGLFSVEEVALRGTSADGMDNLPAIADRVSTCESCGRQHHRVFATTAEASSMIPLYPTGIGIYSRRAAFMRLHPSKTDQEIDQMLAELDALPKQQAMTRLEWEHLLRQLQQEAELKNREQGMELPQDRR